MKSQIVYESKEECLDHKYLKINKYNLKIPTVFSLQEAKTKLIDHYNDSLKLQKAKLNTFEYIMLNHEGGAIYIDIKNNEIDYTALINMNFVNRWYKFLPIKNPYKYIKTKELNINKPIFNRGFKLRQKNKWTKTGPKINMFDYKQVFTSYQYELIDLLQETAKKYKLNNTCFIIWCKDIPLMSQSGIDIFLPKFRWNHNNKRYLPILSQSTIYSPKFYDIPIINADEWRAFRRKYIPGECKFDDINAIKNVPWNNKIEKGFFRGKMTGNTNDLTNKRLLITVMTEKYPDYLDAGISGEYMYHDKIDLQGNLSYFNIKYMKNIKKLSWVDMANFSEYKYILNIEGNGLAYRKSFLFYLKSVVLNVESKYKSWFDDLLEPYVHYIPIKEDLSDLIDIIKWCKEHDSECKKIAENGYNFAKEYLCYDNALNFMQLLINSLLN
jgi:hypothetical protein